MRIALLHGWRLFGSGSNEYTRYLARSLAAGGHEVHILCREPDPDRLDFVQLALDWSPEGESRLIYERDPDADRGDRGRCVFHRLPHADVRPVLVSDKQREGPIKPFTALSDEELSSYRRVYVRAVRAVLSAHPVDILHANHMVLQPTVAAEACESLGIPFIIYPHGSAIEYTLRSDRRYLHLAGEAIQKASGLIIGSHEVQSRLLTMYAKHTDKLENRTRIVGVGVDTALFAPVPRTSRLASIRKLIELAPGGGKPPELVLDLHRRLAQGELEAVGSYQTAYTRGRPDADCRAHLARIPWQSGSILLFVGALTVGKGLHRLIAALPQLLHTVPDAHLVIVGSGAYREVLEALVYAISRADERLLDKLVTHGYELVQTHLSGSWTAVSSYLESTEHRRTILTAGREFAGRVHFMGRLTHQHLRYLFPCTDLAVFPSIIPEAYPLVLMESLANGVLPAASGFSGFAEGIQALAPDLGEDVADLMHLPIDPHSAIAGMATRMTLLVKLGAGDQLKNDLRRIAVRDYDWSHRAAQMHKAYNDFLSR